MLGSVSLKGSVGGAVAPVHGRTGAVVAAIQTDGSSSPSQFEPNATSQIVSFMTIAYMGQDQ